METRNYETVFIVNPGAPENRLTDINSRNQQIIESYKGKVLHLEDWGKKKMAYPIRKEAKGHYFWLTYNGDMSCVAELERNMRINEDVFRFLTVKMEETLDPMAAVEAYKRKQEAHAKREKERAERDAEKNAERGERGGGFRARGGFRPDRGERMERQSPVEAPVEEAVETEMIDEE